MTRHPFKHVLITRFNVRVSEWRNVDKNGVPVLDDAWMIHRIDLFERYTLPTVMAQTCRNFDWLLLMDHKTPQKFKEYLEEGTDYHILYVKNWLVDLQAWLQAINQPWLVTTRLDNDDCISPEFIATIQKHITTKQFHFINLTKGYTLDGHKLRPIQHMANPFMTLVEPIANAKSILFTPHGRAMSKHGPIVQVSKGRFWTQIIHERNYING